MSEAGGRGPVLVGVTGHRVLEGVARIEAGLEEALRRVESEFPGRPVALLSALAEGADRLAAHVVLARAGATLTAVLPLARDDYARDFRAEASRREFFDLLARAREVVELPRAASREEAYEAAGVYVVERCDVLLAVWDGRPARGRGGTAQIVGLARARRLPLAWVHSGVRPEADSPEETRANAGDATTRTDGEDATPSANADDAKPSADAEEATTRAPGVVTFENF